MLGFGVDFAHPIELIEQATAIIGAVNDDNVDQLSACTFSEDVIETLRRLFGRPTYVALNLRHHKTYAYLINNVPTFAEYGMLFADMVDAIGNEDIVAVNIILSTNIAFTNKDCGIFMHSIWHMRCTYVETTPYLDLLHAHHPSPINVPARSSLADGKNYDALRNYSIVLEARKKACLENAAMLMCCWKSIGIPRPIMYTIAEQVARGFI